MKFTKRDRRNKVERRIDEKIEEFIDQAMTKEEVAEVIGLVKDKNEMLASKPRLIKPDTMALIAANLLGIVLIMNFEKANVITSKALGFVMRGRA